MSAPHRYSAFRRALAAPFRCLLAPLLHKNKTDREQEIKALKNVIKANRLESSTEIKSLRAAMAHERRMLEKRMNDLFYARFRDTWHQDGERKEYFSHFLLLSCNCIEANLSGALSHGVVNLGDWVQAHAVKHQMQKHYPALPRTFWGRDTLSLYQGEKAFTVMQGWFAYGVHFFPNDSIWPVYIGFHAAPQAQDAIISFLRFNPHYFDGHQIGCRDRYTLDFCQKIGLDAYFSRCNTLTFPRREQTPENGKVFIVDVPERLRKFIPSSLRENAVIVNQRDDRSLGTALPDYVNKNEHNMQKTGKLLARYRDEAALIITIAVHCASPCTAMGIPVVLINVGGDEATRRFDFISDILPIWTEADLKEGRINWEPEVPDIEALKADMELNLSMTIEQERSGVPIPELQAVRQRLLTAIR